METSLDLEFNEDQLAIAAAVSRFCEQQDVEQHARHPERDFPKQLWCSLADLGVFSPATPVLADSGGALEICVICETLGRYAFPGPLPATYLAMQLFEGPDAESVRCGDALVCLSREGSNLLPWGNCADIFLVAGNQQLSIAAAPSDITPVTVLGSETWATGTLELVSSLQNAPRGLAIANISSAAYLAAAGMRLIELACEHAATRKQFGQVLGDFQAVSHPLAEAILWVSAAQTLARTAASGFDLVTDMNNGTDLIGHKAAAAAMSARRAALNAAFICHQVFGGIGVTLEGPIFHYSRRIRQLASLPPADTGEMDQVLNFAGLGRPL